MSSTYLPITVCSKLLCNCFILWYFNKIDVDNLELNGVESFMTEYLIASDLLVTGQPLDTSVDMIYVFGQVMYWVALEGWGWQMYGHA